jgi:hypothetical protein
MMESWSQMKFVSIVMKINMENTLGITSHTWNVGRHTAHLCRTEPPYSISLAHNPFKFED